MSNKTNSASFKLDRKMIALIIAGVAAILCFVGLFGTSTCIKGVTVSMGKRVISTDSIDITLAYIFNDGWNGAVGTEKLSLILIIIAFFAGIGGFVFAITKTLYSVYKKEEIDLNLCLTVLLVTAGSYLFMTRFVSYDNIKQYDKIAKTSSNLIYLLGWGGALITAGFFLGLVAMFVYDFKNKEAVLNKNSVCRRIASIAIFFIGLYGLANLVSIGDETIIKESSVDYGSILTLNVFKWVAQIFTDGAESVFANLTTIKILSVIALIFAIISFAGFITAAIFFIKGGKSNLDKKLPLIGSIVFVGSTLISNILLMVSGHLSNGDEVSNILETKHSTDPGFTFIVGLILGIGLIVLAVLANKEKKISKTK